MDFHGDDLLPARRASNIVGAIADFNEIGGDHFKFIGDTVDPVTKLGLYTLGDVPIDGLIAAKNFSQKTSNFTPQARLVINSDINSAPLHYTPVDPNHPTTPSFYDNDNQI